MVPARKIYEPEVIHQPIDKAKGIKRETKKRSRHVVYKRLSLFVAVIMCFVAGIMLEFYYAQAVYLGHKINLLQEEVTNLKLESFYLEEQIAQVTTLDRIESVAVNKLGMVKPDDKNVVALPVTSFPAVYLSKKNIEDIYSE